MHGNLSRSSHIIDHNGKLHNFLLSTTEIKQRRKSQHLREHIKAELVKWGLDTTSDTVTTNFNSTNENDIEAETEDIDDEVDFCKKLDIIEKKKMNHLTTT